MERPEMTKKSDHLEVVDTTGLTDADWAEIDKLKNAYDAGGQKALLAALNNLEQKALSEKDPERAIQAVDTFCTVKCALFPGFRGRLREAIRDDMAANGITKEDLQALGALTSLGLPFPSRICTRVSGGARPCSYSRRRYILREPEIDAPGRCVVFLGSSGTYM